MFVCLVTGGAGFMGSHLVDALVARGDAVRVLDNFSTSTLANLTQVKDRIDLISADVNDACVLEKAIEGVDYVFHLTESGTNTIKEPDTPPGRWATATDTLSVLMAARAAGVRRVIYASSGSVYGPMNTCSLKESHAGTPVSPSGFAKLTAENQCTAFTLLYGLETVRLRFFKVFGPRQSVSKPFAAYIPAILQSMLAAQSPIIAENPFEEHDFLSVADAVHATLLATEATRAAGKAYNIARGRNSTLAQVVAATNQILGTNLPPSFTDVKTPAELAPTVDISRAEADLGFCPSNDLKQGLKRFLDYLRLQRPEHCNSAPKPVHQELNSAASS
jgi:UDP-glucose 4-epimerase